MHPAALLARGREYLLKRCPKSHAPSPMASGNAGTRAPVRAGLSMVSFPALPAVALQGGPVRHMSIRSSATGIPTSVRMKPGVARFPRPGPEQVPVPARMSGQALVTRGAAHPGDRAAGCRAQHPCPSPAPSAHGPAPAITVVPPANRTGPVKPGPLIDAAVCRT